MPSSSVTMVSKCTIVPEESSTIKPLRLSVSDLPMLSCQYIQKGVLLTSPPYAFAEFVQNLKTSLSAVLVHFPALAGRLSTDSAGHVSILCNDAGVDFIVAKAKRYSLEGILPPDSDLPECFREFFAYDRTLSYTGHSRPLAAVMVTELADGVFVGCTVNHAVTDGTSFWHFFNTFAELCKSPKKKFVAKSPDLGRDTVFDSPAVLHFPPGGPAATFSGDEPLRERIFHFSRESITRLKLRANQKDKHDHHQNNNINYSEILGKSSNDKILEVSSFQSLCAQLWRSVTRARNLDGAKTTTFRMAVNCRHRVSPPMGSHYFGNAIQSIPTYCEAAELLSEGLGFCAGLLHRNVVAHGDATVRRGVAAWEAEPRLFPLGNFDGASITMGSSPRFPMYDNDFGWGRPAAVRSGRANKFDGKISAFPGREGNGSVDLEVVLSPETMAGLLADEEFMQYVSTSSVAV